METSANKAADVDDAVQIDKVNMVTVDRSLDSDGGNVRVKHAIQNQNLFLSVTCRAEWKGMKVNEKKTTMLCVSDAATFNAEAYIETMTGEKISSDPETFSVKILGYHISNRPGAAAHVETVRKRYKARCWVLLKLKEFGFTQDELVKVYKTNILPLHDYCAIVYHALLTDKQDETLERLQSHAPRYIFGPKRGE